MERSTKIVILTVGLGGLGYFLYKKGLFSNKADLSTASAVPTVDNGKKTALEPIEKEIKLDSKPLPERLPEPLPERLPEPSPDPYIPIWKQTEIYPVDVLYPQEGKLVKEVVTQDSFNPYLYDKPPAEDRIVKIDYTSDRYSNGVDLEYAEKDLLNIRLNKLLYV